MADAQIILAYSRTRGIVAIASGEKYGAASKALVESGFQRGEAGVYCLPSEDPDASRTTVAGLVRRAAAHGATVTTSSQRFIGDAASDIARLLPGQWETQVELYCHPVWQDDLVPWLWDSGELVRAVQSERIPYAATLTLTDGMSETTLLLVERPGHQLGYLVGAFCPSPFEEGYGGPHAPASIVLPPFPGRAARAITERYLPAFDRALHARRTTAVADALDRIRSEHRVWTAMVASGRDSDATPLSFDALGTATAQFLDTTWREFLTVTDHGPALLDRCYPTATPWPGDAEALAQLADALTEAETVREDLARGTPLTPAERNARTWPAVETWLTCGDSFLRQARAASPYPRPALTATAPPRVLPPARPAPHRWPRPPR